MDHQPPIQPEETEAQRAIRRREQSHHCKPWTEDEYLMRSLANLQITLTQTIAAALQAGPNGLSKARAAAAKDAPHLARYWHHTLKAGAAAAGLLALYSDPERHSKLYALDNLEAVLAGYADLHQQLESIKATLTALFDEETITNAQDRS